MLDVVQQRGSGVMLETDAPLPGETSKTASIAEFVLRGGTGAITGAQDPSMRVPERV